MSKDSKTRFLIQAGRGLQYDIWLETTLGGKERNFKLLSGYDHAYLERMREVFSMVFDLGELTGRETEVAERLAEVKANTEKLAEVLLTLDGACKTVKRKIESTH